MSAPQTLIYGPRFGRRRLGLLVAVFLGAIQEGWIAWPRLTHPLSGPWLPTIGPKSAPTAEAIVLAGVLIFLIAIARNVPKLKIGPSGLTIAYALRSVSARWEDLGEFTASQVQTAPDGRLGDVSSAAAAWDRTSGKRKAKKFVIPDIFDTSMKDILAEIQTAFSDPAVCPKPPVFKFQTVPDVLFGDSGFKWPWMTIFLLTAFVGCYLMEVHFGLPPDSAAASPSYETTIAMGGVNRPLVFAGEWYRLLTAAFLHLGIAHLLANAIVFVVAGYCLERMLGSAWVLGIFFAGAAAGSALNLITASSILVMVGASGGIMAMLACLLVLSYRLPADKRRARLQRWLRIILIGSLVPTAAASASMQVSYSDHLGGAILGLMVGLLLRCYWIQGARWSRFSRGAEAFAIAAAMILAGSGCFAAVRYPAYADYFARKMPRAMMPQTDADLVANADVWVASYPRDARAHLYEAQKNLAERHPARALREIQTAMSMMMSHDPLTPPRWLTFALYLKTFALLSTGDAVGAKRTAAMACRQSAEAELIPAARMALSDAGLCATLTRRPPQAVVPASLPKSSRPISPR